jgi:glycosyltransferase involved in cell wall biosynthesis
VQQIHSRVLEDKGTTVNGVTFRGADAVIATSRAVASCLRATTVEVIYPGIESPLRPVPLHPKETLLLGVAARFVPLKGISTLISAVAKLRKDGLNVRLQIAGSGPCEGLLRQQIRDLEMNEHIEILGWSADLSAIREDWDVAVVPSLEEGFGMAALEAMAIGRPVIASRVGGLPELIANGITGFLVAPGDVNELSTAIAQIAANRDFLASMGVAAWERVRSHFTAVRMAAETVALYERILNRDVPSSVSRQVANL